MKFRFLLLLFIISQYGLYSQVPVVYVNETNLPDPDTRVLNKTLRVGTIPGSFNIGGMGGAIYEIPVSIPPGTNGMQPRISIVYNSQSGNGVLGYGWHLDGLGTITRTGKTYYYDNSYSSVNLDYGDRFEINGTRLICYSGADGYPNSEYKVEETPTSKVKAFGTCGSGPLYFVEETKDGLTIEYGNSASSRLDYIGNNNTIAGWLVNKVTDKAGNYIVYNYNKTEGQNYIKNISYTGNGAILTPYDSVVFSYVDRTSDVWKFYQAKESSCQRKLLQEISIYSEGARIRSYVFYYSGSFYSQLVEVKEKNSNGDECNSTIIKWGAKGDFTSDTIYFPTQYDEYLSAIADYNLDGKDDFVTWTEPTNGVTRWSLYKNTGDGEYSLVDYEESGDPSGEYPSRSDYTPYQYTFSPSDDFTGDGIPDILMKYGDSLLCYQVLNDHLYWVPNNFCTITGLSKWYDGDFNGDGKGELIIIGPSGAAVHSFAQHKTWSISLPGNNIIVSDLDGDLNSEIISLNSTGYSIYNLQYNSVGDYYYFNLKFSENNDYFKASLLTKQFEGDFNGDGYSDFLVKGETSWYVLNYTGEKFISDTVSIPIDPSLDPFTANADNSVYVRDLNNDYRSDIVVSTTLYSGTTPVSNKIDFYLFNGTGFKSYTYTINSNQKASAGSLLFGVYGGDASVVALLNMSNIIYHGGFDNVNLVAKIADGFNNKTTYTFNKGIQLNESLTRPSVVYPLQYHASHLTVIDEVSFATESRTLVAKKILLNNPLVHRKGKGLLGVCNASRTDLLSGLKEVVTYGVYSGKASIYESSSHLYDGTNAELKNSTLAPSFKTFTWGGFTISGLNNFRKDILTSTNDTISVVYDDYGNELSIISKYSGDGKTTLINVFSPAGSWCPSKLVSSTSTSKKNGSTGEFTQIFKYDYNALGQIVKQRHSTNTPDSLIITYHYNEFGALIKKTIVPKGNPTRSENYSYDTKNRLPVNITSGALQVTKTYDYRFGNVLTETDPGGNTTTYTYDVNGRPIKVSRTATQYTDISYSWNTGEPAQAVIMTEVKANGGNTSKTWYDGVGREVRRSVKGFNGEDVIVDKLYNQNGQIKKISQPYFAGGNQSWNWLNYDTIGRVINLYENGSGMSFMYNNKTVAISKFIDRKLWVVYKTYNGLGQLTNITDNGLSMSFTYADNGNIQTVSPPGTGAQLNYSYDSRGLPTQENDPDRGSNQVNFNSLGQKVLNVDASGNQASTFYDILGRDSLWVRPGGNTTFNYLTSGAAKGAVNQIVTPTEIRKYKYDTMGRIIRVCDSINTNEKMAYAYEYDNYGRVNKLTYPTGYFITYVYNTQGYLSEIRDGSSNTLLWQCTNVDAKGNITAFTMGNNINVTRTIDDYGRLSQVKTMVGANTLQWFEYSFKKENGNLVYRKDKKRTFTENFGYDFYDRLLWAKGTNIDSLRMKYDNIGNITSKSDVGKYYYDTQRVHAVDSLSPTASGSMFGDQNIVYNYMNLPDYISNETDSLVYQYGVGTSRIKATHYSNGQLLRTTWYGNSFERVVEGTTEKFYHWVQSPDGPVALVIKTTGGSTTTYYLCRDHLNSITGILSSTGTMVEEYSYDPWGRRRSPSNWSYTVTMPTITKRGYTGHEHLDAFGIIHMNGRLYDPHLARVLNPDPIILNMENIQSYNRYSYCLNNPLKYTDPTGYWPDNNGCKDRSKNWTWWDSFKSKFFHRIWNPIKRSFEGGGSGNGVASHPTNIPGTPVGGTTGTSTSFSSNRGSSSVSAYRSGLSMKPDVLDPKSGGRIHGPMAADIGSDGYTDERRYGGKLYSIDDQLEAFGILWKSSYNQDGSELENSAWLTTKGVLVLPNYKNTANKASFEYYPYFQRDGKWYVSFLGEDLEIIGSFHTHPGGKEYDWINGDDWAQLRPFGPVFILSDYNLIYCTNGGYQNLTTNETFLKNGLWGCKIPGF